MPLSLQFGFEPFERFLAGARAIDRHFRSAPLPANLPVLLGLFGVWLVKTFTEWQAVVTPGSVILSLSISCMTGVVFGLYPARRAAAMDPIEALRHE